MKIRFLLHDVFGRGGGVVTVTLSLAGELAKRHDVELVSMYGSSAAPAHRLPANVEVKSLVEPVAGNVNPRRARLSSRPSAVIPAAEKRSSSYNRYTDKVLRRYLASLSGGALVTMQPGLIIAAEALGTDQYVHVAQDHCPLKIRPGGIRKAYRQLGAGLDTFLTLSDQDGEDLRGLIKDRIPVATMTNGAPPYEGSLATCDRKVVIAAGRLSRIKGFDILIDAWTDVTRRQPDWQLQIWGEGNLRAQLQERIIRAGLQGQVRLMGFSTQVQKEMSEAAFLVLSSRHEGFGRVLIEAMACGLPVVSTDCPWGPRQIVDHEVNGLLVPSEEPRALAEAINDMIERGTSARLAMGRAGLARATENSQEVVARRWEELLTRLSEKKGLLDAVPR